MPCPRAWCCLIVAAAACPAQRAATGRVVDVRGRPVPAARVEVAAEDGATKVSFSDGEGIYHVVALPAGRVRARITAPGKAAATFVRPGWHRDLVQNVVLPDGATVRGVVTDARGRRVAGVDVLALFEGGSCRARTDEAGGYQLPNVAVGEVAVLCWGGDRPVEQRVALQADRQLDLALPARRGRVQSVVVTGLRDHDEAFVHVYRTDPGLDRSGGRYPLAADGTATFLTTGCCLVTPVIKGFVTRPAGQLAHGVGAPLRFRVGGRTADEPVVRIAGRLRDGRGRTIRDASLVVHDLMGTELARATVDRRGGFRFALPLTWARQYRLGLPLDRWELLHDERTLRDGVLFMPLWPGDDDLRVLATPTGRIDATVTTPDGVALALADVRIVARDDGERVFMETTTDRSGHLRLGLPAGRYTLLATSVTGRVCRAEVQLLADRTCRPPTWEDVPCAPVEGRVRTAAGAPLAGVEVVLVATRLRHGAPNDARRLEHIRLRTDREGRFRCPAVPAGEWSVVAPDREDVPLTDVEVRAGKPTAVELRRR